MVSTLDSKFCWGFGGGFIHGLIAQCMLRSVGSTGSPWDFERFASLLVIILD